MTGCYTKSWSRRCQARLTWTSPAMDSSQPDSSKSSSTPLAHICNEWERQFTSQLTEDILFVALLALSRRVRFVFGYHFGDDG